MESSFLTQTLEKTASRKFHGLGEKHFGNSVKDCYILSFHNGSKNMFMDTSRLRAFNNWDEILRNTVLDLKNFVDVKYQYRSNTVLRNILFIYLLFLKGV